MCSILWNKIYYLIPYVSSFFSKNLRKQKKMDDRGVEPLASTMLK